MALVAPAGSVPYVKSLKDTRVHFALGQPLRREREVEKQKAPAKMRAPFVILSLVSVVIPVLLLPDATGAPFKEFWSPLHAARAIALRAGRAARSRTLASERERSDPRRASLRPERD